MTGRAPGGDRAPLLLASRSPRRARLLDQAGIPWRPGPFPDVDETPPPGEDPPGVARALAERKVRAAAPRAPGATVLAADTVVYVDGRLLGKPADAAAAQAALRALSGREHAVATGVAVARGGRVASGVAVTHVRFRPLAEAEIRAYVATGEPLDKAGAYGIQGGAKDFVEAVDGDVDTVIGLPVALLRSLLARLDAAEGEGVRSAGADGR